MAMFAGSLGVGRTSMSKSIPFILFVVLLLPVSGQGQGRNDDYVVLFRDGVSAAERSAAAERAGASVRFNYTTVSAAAVHAPNASVLAALTGSPSVLRVV